MYCPNCGTPNLAQAETCTNCKMALPRLNQPVNPPNAPVTPPSNESGPVRPDYYPGLPASQYSYVPPTTPYSGQPAYYTPTGYSAYTPVYSYPAERNRQEAGFWVRLGAALIDSIIVGLVTLIIVGIPQLFYWTGFASRYATEISNNCPNNYYDDASSVQACDNTLNSIFLNRNELGTFLLITIGCSIAALMVALVYYVGMTARGATLGKKVFGLKVVREDGTPPGFGRALLRQTVGYWISGAILYLGFIWVAFDDHKQGWHDKISQTYVVRA